MPYAIHFHDNFSQKKQKALILIVGFTKKYLYLN